MVLLPEGLKALKKVAKEVGLDLRGAYLNLDGGFDSARNRQCIFNAELIPNIKENPLNRKHTKRGRKCLFNEVIYALRMHVERTFAWEDKFKRLLAVAQKSPCEEIRVIMGKEFPLKLSQRGRDAREEVPMRTPKRLYAAERIIYQPELLTCLHCGALLVLWNYLAWDKTVQ